MRLGKTTNSSDAPQRVHASTESWASAEMPLSVRNEPAGHRLHEYEPADEYEPAGQTWQSSALSWASAELPLSVRNKPAGHRLHVPAPEDEYEPARQT